MALFLVAYGITLMWYVFLWPIITTLWRHLIIDKNAGYGNAFKILYINFFCFIKIKSPAIAVFLTIARHASGTNRLIKRFLIPYILRELTFNGTTTSFRCLHRCFKRFSFVSRFPRESFTAKVTVGRSCAVNWTL